MLGDFLGRSPGLGRERLHFGGDHGEPFSRITGTGRLDGGVQSQQVGLGRDLANHICYRADTSDPLVQGLHRFAGLEPAWTARPTISVDCATCPPISWIEIFLQGPGGVVELALAAGHRGADQGLHAADRLRDQPHLKAAAGQICRRARGGEQYRAVPRIAQ